MATLKVIDGVIVIDCKDGLQIEIHSNDSVTLTTKEQSLDIGNNTNGITIDGHLYKDLMMYYSEYWKTH